MKYDVVGSSMGRVVIFVNINIEYVGLDFIMLDMERNIYIDFVEFLIMVGWVLLEYKFV